MGKPEILVIRCQKEVKKRFREFVVKVDATDYESALVYLLDYYEGKVSKLPVRTYGPI